MVCFDKDKQDSVVKKMDHVHAAHLLHAHRLIGWLLNSRYDQNQI